MTDGKAGAYYRGVPLEELEIISVHWPPEAEQHIATRTERYGSHEINIETEWATEAATDEYALMAASKTTRSLVVVGHSAGMPSGSAVPLGRVLKCWLSPTDLIAGEWEGRSAAVANDLYRNLYWKRRLGNGGQVN